ncbi:hypothetical protein IHQ68_16110 [Chelatococcus sambhunathii]|uniref:Uncharacterized protein n=1 Tax=Chelatococcus sambhunathii TaxID=363953 RepID=A0ABU1DJ38_9HYPH|nr:hypothetical protein [Chelatococcus sambhunathii]MDR4308145.1 hypothetical protein [Chelatococcus sambhunathii]
MSENLSQRVGDQRVRNRIMEVTETLAFGDEGVRQVGLKEYFEQFYDWIPNNDDGSALRNSAITEIERNLITAVRTLLDNACDVTPDMSEEEFIETGWPRRIQPFARETLDVMLRRGKFSEEIVPSS